MSRHIRRPLRRTQFLVPGAVVSPQAARLGAGVAAALGVSIQFQNLRPAGTALHLVGRDGRLLCNYLGAKQTGSRGRPTEPRYPIRVAIVPDDPGALVAVYFEDVPGTSVGYEGDHSAGVEEAIAHIANQYRAAVDPNAPAWHLGSWLGNSRHGT
jgi:hypothetical protein